ncbi:unnamed protein product [Gulo gulo]|uniref:Uncharacterized protein n=1 Tax=Gulo gulo TaxID=48420 RepID=A0A9X9PUD3_GULGU|nr:unnamed protein product [Gulo gulo]
MCSSRPTRRSASSTWTRTTEGHPSRPHSGLTAWPILCGVPSLGAKSPELRWKVPETRGSPLETWSWRWHPMCLAARGPSLVALPEKPPPPPAGDANPTALRTADAWNEGAPDSRTSALGPTALSSSSTPPVRRQTAGPEAAWALAGRHPTGRTHQEAAGLTGRPRPSQRQLPSQGSTSS